MTKLTKREEVEAARERRLRIALAAIPAIVPMFINTRTNMFSVSPAASAIATFALQVDEALQDAGDEQ